MTKTFIISGIIYSTIFVNLTKKIKDPYIKVVPIRVPICALLYIAYPVVFQLKM